MERPWLHVELIGLDHVLGVEALQTRHRHRTVASPSNSSSEITGRAFVVDIVINSRDRRKKLRYHVRMTMKEMYLHKRENKLHHNTDLQKVKNRSTEWVLQSLSSETLKSMLR